jgi:hypothetical protein
METHIELTWNRLFWYLVDEEIRALGLLVANEENLKLRTGATIT